MKIYVVTNVHHVILSHLFSFSMYFIYEISLCLFTPTYIVITYMKYMEKINKWDNIIWCTLVTTYIFIPYMTYVGYIE